MKKSKNRYLIEVIACFALLAASLCLTACANHAHGYSGYEYDADGHWQTCSDCGEKTEKTDHEFGEWSATKDATCEETGEEQRVCSVCGAIQLRNIQTLPHAFETRFDANNHWKECTVCGEISDVATHAFGNWIITEKATCTAVGSKKRDCGCGFTDVVEIPVAEHKLETDLYYATEDGRVVSFKKCALCGEKFEKTVVVDAVVATPETAQEALDKAGNGAFIYFAAGTYDQPLYLRQNKFTSKVKKKDTDSEYLPIGGLSPTGTYCYYRQIENLTLYGGEGANFTAKFNFGSGHAYGVAGLGYPENFDAVREVPLQSTNTSYYGYLYADGLTLKNMHFEGIDGRIDVAMQMPNTHLNGFTVDRCVFDASSVGVSDRGSIAAIHLITDVGGNYKNITLKNSTIDGYFQGIYLQNAENVLCEGNTIRNTTHNAVAVQSNESGFSGTVTIRGNRFSETGDRAIRFGIGKNAEISVENNVFSEIRSYQLLKSESLTDCTYRFENNVYGDNSAPIKDVAGSGSAFSVSRPTGV